MCSNTNDLDSVLKLVFSSNRVMPAHYSSSENRKKTFLVDFDISETDEYEMASEAFYSVPGYLDEKNTQSLLHPWFDMVCKIGEDIMLGNFIAAKKEFAFAPGELSKEIIKENIGLWEEGKDLETLQQIILPSQQVVSYLKHCEEFGRKRAETL